MKFLECWDLGARRGDRRIQGKPLQRERTQHDDEARSAVAITGGRQPDADVRLRQLDPESTAAAERLARYLDGA